MITPNYRDYREIKGLHDAPWRHSCQRTGPTCLLSAPAPGCSLYFSPAKISWSQCDSLLYPFLIRRRWRVTTQNAWIVNQQRLLASWWTFLSLSLSTQSQTMIIWGTISLIRIKFVLRRIFAFESHLWSEHSHTHSTFFCFSRPTVLLLLFPFCFQHDPLFLCFCSWLFKRIMRATSSISVLANLDSTPRFLFLAIE